MYSYAESYTHLLRKWRNNIEQNGGLDSAVLILGDGMTERILAMKSSWEKIKESGLPVVVYGMGNGADKVLDEFERLDIPVLGVTASDDFVRGQMFRGFKVTKLSEFDGEFIVAIGFATCIPEVMNHINSLSEKYRVIVPCVPVFGDEIFNRDFIIKNKSRIDAAYSLIDDESKRIYEGCISFVFGGELKDLKDVTTGKDEVFSNILKLSENESFLDLGAYRGDTVEEFLHYTGGKYEHIIALEPDRRSFKKLSLFVENMKNVTAVQKAVSDRDGVAYFNSAAGRQSSFSDKGESIETVTVDTLCNDVNITYIKMDVEGAENEAISGAVKTLSECKPKLNIALYHRSEDIFSLLLKIHSINPKYKFYIRRHPYIPCWDLNLYCV